MKIIRFALAIATLALFSSAALPADTITYTNGDGTWTLDDGNNWSFPYAVPGTGDEAVLDNSNSVTYTNTLTLSSSLTFGDLVINATGIPAITLTGSTAQSITLSGGGGSTAATAAGGASGDLLVLGTNVTAGTVSVGGGTGSGKLSIALGTSGNFDVVNAGATLDVSGPVTGSGLDLTANGAGTLELDGNNTFNNLNILNGTVSNGSVTSGATFGLGTITLGASSGSNNATLNDGSDNISNNIVVQAGNTGTLTIEASVENPTLSGNIALNNNVIFDEARSAARSITFSGTITGASTITTMSNNISHLPGVLITGNNATTFTGNVVVATGILSFNMNSLGQNSTGGTISFGNTTGLGLTWNGVNTQDLSGRLQALTSGSSVTLDLGSNNVTFATANGLAGSGTYIKSVASSGVLTLAAANSLSGTYTPATVGGTTLLTNANALQDASVSLLANTTSGGITFDSSVAGHAFNFGGLTGSGSMTLVDNGSNAVALTIGNNNYNNTYSGILSGAGSITKAGTANQVFSGQNVYTGATTVNGGTLQAGVASILNASGAFGNKSAVTVGSSGTLDINNFNTAIGSLSGSGTVTNGGATTATLYVGTDNTNTSFSGVIAGSSHLVLAKIGTGALTLSGANTYTGATMVNSGTLELDFSAGGAPTSNIISSGSALTMNGGTLLVNGAASANNTQAFNGTTAASGNSTMNITDGAGGTVVVTLGALTSTGGAINFNLPAGNGLSNGFVTSTDASAGIFGGWATVNGTDFATDTGANTAIVAYTGYTDINTQASTIANGSTTNVRINAITTGGNDTIGSPTTSINTLMQNTSGASTVALGGGTLNFGTSGAIFVNTNAGSTGNLTIGATVGDGSIDAGGPTSGTSGTLTLNNSSSATLTINSNITNNGSGVVTVWVDGTGQIVLNGANTYTGGTTLGSGILDINSAGVASTSGPLGNGGAFNILGGTIDNTSGAAEVVANVNPITIGGSFAYSTAAGTTANNLTLPGAVTMAADQTITLNGLGDLTLSGLFSDTTTSSGRTLTVNSGSGTGATSQLTLSGGLSLASSSTVRTDIIDGNGTIAITGAITGGSAAGSGLTYDGTGTLILAGANTYTGTTTLISGTLDINSAGVASTSGPLGNGGTFLISGGTIDNTSGSANVVLNSNAIGISGSFSFGTAAGTTNNNLTLPGAVSTGSYPVITLNGLGDLDFSGTLTPSTSNGGQVLTVNNGAGTGVTTALTIGNINLNSVSNGSDNLTLTGSGNIIVPGVIAKGAATDSLTYSGTGTLTLGGINTYTGGTTISNGTVISTGTRTFGSGGLAVNSATLDLQNTVTGTYGSSTGVTGNVQFISDAATSGSAGLTYTFGALSIGTSTLTVSGGANVNSGTAGITFGTTTSTGNTTFTVNNPSAGGNTLLTLGAVATTAGSTVNFNGTGATTLASLANTAGTSVVFSDAGGTTITGAVSGANSGSITNAATSTLTITGGNANTGGLNIQQGTVKVGNTSSVGAGLVTIGSTGNTGTLDLNGLSENFNSLATAGTAANQVIGNSSTTANAVLFYNGATTSTFGGVIKDALPGGTHTTGVTVSNAAANLTLSGANTYSGTTTVTSGTLVATNSASALGTSTVSLAAAGTLYLTNPSGTNLNFGNNVVLTGNAKIYTDVTSAGNGDTFTMGTLTSPTTGSLTLTIDGGNNVTGGTAGVTFGAVTTSVTSTFTVNDPTNGGTTLLTLASITPTAGNLVFTGAGNTTVTGGILGAATAVTKSGTGTFNLQGASTYTGATADSAGVLALSNGASLGGTTVTVGTASVNATLQVSGNATIGSGAAGALTLDGGNGSSTGQGTLNLVDGTTNTLTLANTTTTGNVFTVGGATAGSTASVLDLEVGSTGADEIVASTGKVLINTGLANINITGLGGLSTGTQTLVSGTAATGGSDKTYAQWAAGATLGTSGNFNGYTVSLGSTLTSLTLTETANASPSGAVYWYGASAGVTGGTTAWNSFENGNTDTSNFSTSATASSATNATGLLGATSDVNFNATSGVVTGSGSTTLGQNFTIDSLTFNTSGVGIAAGGTNTLTINTSANSATYGINDTASSGTDTISAPVVLGNSQTWSVNSGGTLVVSGAISGGQALTTTGAGTTVFTGNNGYTGGTVVGGGSLFLNNTAGSGAGTGSLTVSPGATLGGTGSYGTTANPGAGYSIAGTGTATGLRANVLVGMSSAIDANTTQSLTMIASSTATITNANLTFNINSQVVGQGTELNVGSTLVAFGSGVQSTTLSLNVENAGVITGNPFYVLIAGNTTNAVDQYSGLNLGTGVGDIATGLLTPILDSGVGQTGDLTLALTGLADTWYGAHSELFLYQNSGTGADDIEVEVVPEPGTWALMLGGLAFLVFWQRSRRKQA